MELTHSLAVAEAREYAAVEPLYAVEQEQVDLLPDAFRGGDYGWRDAEWVVQWYFRRHLGGYDDGQRRASEQAYGNNDFDAVRQAISSALAAEDTDERLDSLTELVGVDVSVASAFLQFVYPSRYVVVGEREWGVLRAAGELDAPFPSTVDADAYQTYSDTCRDLRGRLDVDAWTLYRALWRLGGDSTEN